MYFDWRLFRMAGAVWPRLALATGLGIAALLVAIARLSLMGVVIAEVWHGAALTSLAGPLAAAGLLILVRAALMLAKEEVCNRAAAIVKCQLRRRLYEHIQRLGPGQLDQRRSGDVATSLVEGVEQLDTFFGPYIPHVVVALLTPLILFAVMAALDRPTAIIFLVFALISLVAPAALHRWNASGSLARRYAYAALASDLLDSIQGLATLKAFGQSRARGDLLAERAHALFRSTMRVLAANQATGSVTLLGVTGGAALALGWGAVRVQAGDLDLRTLMVVLLLGAEVFRPLRDLTALYHRGMLGLAAARSIFDILDTPPRVQDPEHPVNPPAIEPRVVFEQVSFAYEEGRRPALRDVSFTLEPGETLGVVGPSGAGKSTLVNLLLRFADPQQGRILLGGHDLRDLPLETLRRQIAVVTQDTYLFYGTIEENLRVGKPDATQEELEAAVRAANAHDFIVALPHGYQTVVGERGTQLSGGQRQRLAIARALLKDAPILVLDEATSSVDAEHEAAIQEALERLTHGRTTMVIAHRLSTVANADRIVVLEGGRIVESGRHDALLACGGVYARLMAAQTPLEQDRELVSAALEGDGVARGAPEAFEETIADRAERAPTSSGVPTAGALPTRQVWARLFGLVRPWWGELGVTFVLGISQAAGTVAVGVISALLVARVASGEPISGHLWLLGALVPLTALLTWGESWAAHDLAFRLLAEMRIALYRLLDPLAPAYLQRRRSGDIVSLATADIETIEYFFAHTISPAFVAVLVPGGVLIALGLISGSLALTLLPFLAAVALTPVVGSGALERLGDELRRQLGAASAHMVDSVQGLRTIAAFNYGAARTEEIVNNSWRLSRVQVRFLRDQALQRSSIEALQGLGMLAVLTVGVGLATSGRMGRYELPLVTLLAASAFGPIADLAKVAKQLMETLASARRYFAVEDEPVVVRDGPGVVVASPRDGVVGLSIAFEGVSFRYRPDAPWALRDVTFTIQAGQTAALVGPSGAGKSTVVRLLNRFWDPQEGLVRIGGHDIRDFALDHLRQQIALVDQDTYLFNTTLWENLRLGNPAATDEEVLAAARAANVDEVAAALPDGYQTRVGEGGFQLSGGQRQRVAIARALLKNAPILVLDEATSHLDAVNEAEVRQALQRLTAGRTTLVIAHRLSTVRNADTILVLDAGRLVEQGSHTELLARDGLYRRLVSTQLVGRQNGAAAPAGQIVPPAAGSHASGHRTGSAQERT